jgi:hypothetical protein
MFQQTLARHEERLVVFDARIAQFHSIRHVVVVPRFYLEMWSSLCAVIHDFADKKGTKLNFKSLTPEKRHVLCVGVGGDRTHVTRSG